MTDTAMPATAKGRAAAFCERFGLRLPILLAPAIRLMHHSRGSVRGNSPLRAEYLRGYHHAQSKILFAAKYSDGGNARSLRHRVLALALLGLPLRLLLPQPRQVARLLGRIAGLWNVPAARG